MALSNVVINNGAATPVAKTFTPVQELPVAVWKDKTTGISIGMPTITWSVNYSSSKRPTNKWACKVTVPVLEVAASAGIGGYTAPAKVAYTLLADVNLVAPDRATEAERSDLIAFIGNYLSLASTRNMVKTLSPAS